MTNSNLLVVDQGTGEIVTREVGEISSVAREQTEIQAAIVSAKKFPRNEAQAYTNIIKAFERPSLADAAMYRFPRGGAQVTGPSVDCARELARCWGNIRYGLRVVSLDEDTVHIKGYANDLESNTYVEAEDKFARRILRKGVWVKPDERDLRELINRRGAILVRNAILQLIPTDIVDSALAKAMETQRKAAAGELSQGREDAIKKLVRYFEKLGVTSEMIKQRLGHELSEIDDQEVADLRAIWKSISDGNSKREEYFEFKPKSGALELNQELEKKKNGN